ncbi:MAG: hypothetical protein AAF479_03425 [Pseudomonadota bacterium]
MKTTLAAIAFLMGTTWAANAAPLCEKLGFAGLLAKCNKGEEIEITLAAGEPLHDGDLKLQSGAYYEMMITSDGSAELALAGASFFRAIWMDEIVINQIEVRPMAIDSLEFDAAGTAELSFIAIKPGRYTLGVPGARGDNQTIKISIQ